MRDAPGELPEALEPLRLTPSLLGAGQLGSDSVALGYVVQVPGEDRRSCQVDSVDGQLGREYAPVRAHRLDLNTRAEDRPLTGGEVPGQARAVVIPHVWWDDELGHLTAHGVLTGVAEHALRRRVELDHPALVVHADDGIQGGVQDGGLAGLAGQQRVDRALGSGYVARDR